MATTTSISPTTNEEYYSGDWTDIKDICRVLNISSENLSLVTQPAVERYMEMVDRAIDGTLEQQYYTPLRYTWLTRSDGVEVPLFPGKIRKLARYWSAGLLLNTEFQQLLSNISEQATAYVETSQKELFNMLQLNQRIPGQIWKSSVGPTMIPGLQPVVPPEPNF